MHRLEILLLVISTLTSRRAVGSSTGPTIPYEFAAWTTSRKKSDPITGSLAINEQLSKKRAEAVRQYFIANGTLSEEKVTAIGYGAERPLSPNDTPEGRAINRRIDVVIKAENVTE